MRRVRISALVVLMMFIVNAMPSFTYALGPNTVDSAAIIDGQVMTSDIAAFAVTTAKIANGAVTDANITGPISASKIEKPANVVVVAKSGGDFATISAALAAINPTADNPYIVKVMPGVYNESVTMKSYVHLQGAGREVTSIIYEDNNIITCNNIVKAEISGFTLAGYIGISNVGSSPIITDNHFNPYGWGGRGINNSSASPVISNNTFTVQGNPQVGIENASNSSPIITNNNLIGDGTAWAGIRTEGGTPSITNNVIRGFQIGIYGAQSGDGAVVSDNLIEGNGTGISTFSGLIKNNTIRNNTNDGIYDSRVINGNTITGNGRYGIQGTSSSMVVTYNKITANTTSDIYFIPGGGNGTLISFNIYDSFTGAGGVGNYNLKSDGTAAPLQ